MTKRGIDQYRMLDFWGEKMLITLTIRVVPHSLIPDEVRTVMVNSMSRINGGWESFPRGCFFQHEVGGNKREGMLEEHKVYEDWLETIGVHKGETILQEWDW